jgi:hypothetical protein
VGSNDVTEPGVVPEPPAVPAVPVVPAERVHWWASLLPLLGVGIGAALAVGAGWVVLAPVVARWTGAVEDAAARDVTFGLLGVVAGLVTAVVLLIWPGARPALHTALVLAAATGASALAWRFGELLGARPLHALALVVVWPLVAAAVTVVRSLVAVLFGPP